MTPKIRPNAGETGPGRSGRRPKTTLGAALRHALPLGLGLAMVPGASLLPLPGIAPAVAQAQTFGPAIKVNDEVITQYELDQRARLLNLLNPQGNPTAEARDQLIEERLKGAAADSAGIRPGQADIDQGMAEFAGRTSMDKDEFIAALNDSGVSTETFRDFVANGIAWRQLVQGRFGNKVQISEDEIDRAIESQSRPGGVRVLLSEIFIPLQPDPARAESLARQISEMTTIAQFSDAARQYSAAQSRENGGQIDWMDASSLPPVLQGSVMGLAPGEVSDPLPVEGAFALFQMRQVQETGAPQMTYSAVEYAAYYVDGANTPKGQARLAEISAEIDTCDDLYGVAYGQPPQVLDRETLAPAEIPSDIAVELAKLDDNEVSTALRRNGGQTGVVLMLCGRVPTGTPSADQVDRGQVASQLQNRRLASYADGYLAQLRAEARIIE
ncbi:peptidylprolyl isomerase [Pseudooceanicola algae]|uniref:Parvulin-like PPIase n=1 Tax=Pseudooceanicola algae TaxID=1537215 RepID=A0A418SE23_9RHOB|nr:peptidylprolyl isomerase [Pseudooceanicola algae]QPM89547.1 Chaperone SurA [Pseudooceanicola algae]